jgi:hypothetical protein
MIKGLIIASMLSGTCPEVREIGFDSPLTKDEQQSLAHAKVRCGELYPEAPCLKSFEKREEGVFWAICGEVNK